MIFRKTSPKIFCIGFNKTGTTSMATLFQKLNYKVGYQPHAELYFENWMKRDFKPILKYCKSAQAFQDIPFSLPYTYQALHAEYPNAKFILTVRDSSEQWYNSITKFHGKRINKNTPPSADELKKDKYRYEGFLYDYMKETYGTNDNDIYNKKVLIDVYEKHNSNVIDYFKNTNNLIVLNLSQQESFNNLMIFLGVQTDITGYPWENKTS